VNSVNAVEIIDDFDLTPYIKVRANSPARRQTAELAGKSGRCQQSATKRAGSLPNN